MGRIQLLRGAPRDHFAPGEQKNHIGHGGDLLHIVRNHDAGDAERIVQTPDQPQYDSQGNRVETDEWLVVDQDLRVHDDGSRQRDSPAHSARQFRGHEFGRAAEADCLQLREHQLTNEPLRQVGVLA